MSLVFDRVADDYDASRGGAERGAYAAAELEPWLADGPVLEVGVGTGLVAAALTDLGRIVVGLDLSPAMLRRAAERLGTGRLALADARRLPIATAAVSTAVYVYALHAIVDIPAALAEAARVLRPGGRVVAMHGGVDDEPTDMSEAVASLDPLRLSRVDNPDAVARAAGAAGLTTVWHGPTRPVTVPRSPHEIADSIRRRLWSWLWDLDEVVWREQVEPAVARLEALPEPDRPRDTVQRQLLTVLGKG